MNEPAYQVEAMLGHRCNNRCVFCISATRNEAGEARPLAMAPIREHLRSAREWGASRVTLTGGETTLQESFFDILELVVRLDFAEIVLFTNGVRIGENGFLPRVWEVLAPLGARVRQRVVWRLSVQGGTREAHERTTRRPGSWQSVMTALRMLGRERARMTLNTCVVETNYRSLAALPELARELGAESMHLGMMHPFDSGPRTSAELRRLMPRYTEVSSHLVTAVAQCRQLLGRNYPLTIGNYPPCCSPVIASWIRHDGEPTTLLDAGEPDIARGGFDKYADKGRDKVQPPRCGRCVYRSHCSGVNKQYRDLYGLDELRPVSWEEAWQHDRDGDSFPFLVALACEEERAAFRLRQVDEASGEVSVAIRTADRPWEVVLRRAGAATRRSAWAVLAGSHFEAAVVGPMPRDPDATGALRRGLDSLTAHLPGEGPSRGDYPRLRGLWAQTVRRLARRTGLRDR